MAASYNLIKVVVIGDSDVGKTSFIQRFATNEFTGMYSNTAGIDFVSKMIEYESINIKFQIWDTAGQERYRSLITSYFRNTCVVLIVFDLSNLSSFMSTEYWINMAKENICKECIFILVGTKSDSVKKVDSAAISKFINKYNIKYFEISAKNGTNIEKVFHEIASQSNPSIITSVTIEKKLKKERCSC